VNSEFSYSCRTGTTATARGFHSSIGKIPFDVSGRIYRIFLLGIAPPYKSLSLGFPTTKTKEKENGRILLIA
jgi:hypothetical protein